MGKDAEEKKEGAEQVEKKDSGQKDPKVEGTEQVEKKDSGQKDPKAGEAEKNSQQKGPAVEEILGPLDEALGSHIERLLGTRHGIETLPMNLFTVSCLIMIATRETEIESFPYLPPPRYTQEKLLEELAEININPSEDLMSGIDGMIEKGYVEVADDGRFFAQKPSIDMAQIFDRIFPNMPGLNLVAYLGQIIDEALGGRKDINSALIQLNQMLEIQGVPIKSETDPSKPGSKRYPHLRETVDVKSPSGRKASTPKVMPSDIFSQLETKTWASPSPRAKAEASPQDAPLEDKPAIPEPEEFSPPEEMGTAPPFEDAEAQEAVEEEKTVESEGESPVESAEESRAPTETQEDSLTEEPDKRADLLSFMESQATLQEEALNLDDEDIEKKIAAFEEKLGMTCPLCRTSGIRSNETAKGKRYYHCTNSDCNFISWGKPYYITCPQCSNPFLVEAQDSSGRTMLKCPRATCHHWQKPPWEELHEISESPRQSFEHPVSEKKPRRKVKRRRRVVRRKR